MGVVKSQLKIAAAPRWLVCAFAVSAGVFAAGPSRADMAPVSVFCISPGVCVSVLPLDACDRFSLTQAGNDATAPPLASGGDLAGGVLRIDGSGAPISAAVAFGQATSSLPDNVFHEQPVEPAAERVESLPASPSSLAVALSSLVTLGSWRLVRQARQVHLACLPDWYHEGGPLQVGHATVLSLDLRAHLVPVCWYDCESVQTDLSFRPIRLQRWLDLSVRLFGRCYTPSCAPRSPPACG